MKIYAIVLAGGEGKRAGGNKLSKVVDGKPMLQWVIESAKEAEFEGIILVSGKEKDFCEELSKIYNISHVYNENWNLGMGYTLKKGVENLPKEADGFAILLGDMPYIKKETLNTLIKEFSNYKEIVIPTFQGKKGHPPIFSTKYAEEMRRVFKDMGAREVIKNHQEKVKFIEVDDEGILIDIDTFN